MPSDPLLRRLMTPRVSGLAGLGVVVLVTVGCGLSLALHPDYSVLRHYVSQLASRENPGHWFFDGALLLGGVLLVPFSWGLGALVPGVNGRRATWLGMVAGVFMALTGLFPLSLPVAHFGCAFVLFAAAIFATLFVGLGLRDLARGAARPGRLRVAGKGLVGIFGFMLLMTVAGFVHTAFAYRHVTSTDPAAVLKELPRHQSVAVGGLRFNPVAMQEWVFLILAMGLVLVGSVLCLRRPGEAPDTH